MSQRAVTALVFMIVGILAVVVLAGLAEKSLDTTAVAMALLPVLAGVVAGVLARSKTPPKDGDT